MDNKKHKRNLKHLKKTKRSRVHKFVRMMLVAGLTCATTTTVLGLTLKQEPIPEPVNLDDYISPNRTALVALGKALFWDMQVGSDGVQACGSCHFHAGVDSRTRNQISPGFIGATPDNEFGNNFFPGVPALAAGSITVDMELRPEHFPTHRVIAQHDPGDPLTTPGNVISDINDVISSQGVKSATFDDIVPGSPVELSLPLPDPVFHNGTENLRRVEPRNAPSVFNTIFNFFNFWDGRAHNVFNGANPFGAADPRPNLLTNASGTLATEELRLRQASLASLSVGPPLSINEMSFVGRTWPKIGKKMLSLKPLGQQQVDPSDSVLGIIADTAAGTGLTQNYDQLIMAAFPAKYWNNTTEKVTFDTNGVPTILPGSPATTDEYTQMEANFSFFFGIALQMYQSTLVSDDSKFDKVAEGIAAFTPAEANGALQFIANGCNICHIDPIMTDVDVHTIQGLQEPSPGIFVPTALDQNPADANDFMTMASGVAMYDTGTHNTGVRPGGTHHPDSFDYLAVSEDPGRAAFTEMGIPSLAMEVPLSIGAISLWNFGGPIPNTPELWDPTNPPISGSDGVGLDGPALPVQLVDFLPELPPAFLSEDTIPYLGRVNNGGNFKTASLRNVSLSGPYMHNGGMSTLRQVVDFYVRGTDFPNTNVENFDTQILPLGAIRNQDVLVDELVQFLMTLTDDRVANESAPFDHPEIFVPVTGTADHPGNAFTNAAARTELLADSANFMQVLATGDGGRSAQLRAPLQPFLGLDPRSAALTDDADLDTIADSLDNCPSIANPGQEDVGDGDGIGDACDNCTAVSNADQRDTDGDDFGNRCDADLTGDGLVNGADYLQFRGQWLSTAPGVFPFVLADHADFNGDGTVNGADYLIFRSSWLGAPGPSALNP